MECCAGYIDRLQMYRVYTKRICSVYLCFIERLSVVQIL